MACIEAYEPSVGSVSHTRTEPFADADVGTKSNIEASIWYRTAHIVVQTWRYF